jgi:hypothetical protein
VAGEVKAEEALAQEGHVLTLALVNVASLKKSMKHRIRAKPYFTSPFKVNIKAHYVFDSDLSCQTPSNKKNQSF